MNTSTKQLLIASTALTIAAALALTSCGETTEDAPINSRDTIPADVYNMPDGFSNFATKCDRYGNRIYTIWRGNSSTGAAPYGAVAVSPQDPSCKAPTPSPTRH